MNKQEYKEYVRQRLLENVEQDPWDELIRTIEGNPLDGALEKLAVHPHREVAEILGKHLDIGFGSDEAPDRTLALANHLAKTHESLKRTDPSATLEDAAVDTLLSKSFSDRITSLFRTHSQSPNGRYYTHPSRRHRSDPENKDADNEGLKYDNFINDFAHHVKGDVKNMQWTEF